MARALVDPNDHYVLGQGGIAHIGRDGELLDFVNTNDWVRQFHVYQRISHIKFVVQYRVWKVFTGIKRFIRRKKLCMASVKLMRNHPQLQAPLVERIMCMKDMCWQLTKEALLAMPGQHLPSRQWKCDGLSKFARMQGGGASGATRGDEDNSGPVTGSEGGTFTLPEFRDAQAMMRDTMRARLRHFGDIIRGIVRDGCAAMLRNQGNVSEELRGMMQELNMAWVDEPEDHAVINEFFDVTELTRVGRARVFTRETGERVYEAVGLTMRDVPMAHAREAAQRGARVRLAGFMRLVQFMLVDACTCAVVANTEWIYQVCLRETAPAGAGGGGTARRGMVWAQRMVFDPTPDLNVTIDAFEAAFRCDVARRCGDSQSHNAPVRPPMYTQGDGLRRQRCA